MGMQCRVLCHRLLVKPCRIPKHLPSPHTAIRNPVMSTWCSTYTTRKAVPIIQPELTQIKEPTDSTRVYSLSSIAKLPSQKCVLTVSSNKTELTELIRPIRYLLRIMLNDKLVLTGNYPVPIHINRGVVFARDDKTVAHDRGGRENDHSTSGFCWCRQHPNCSWWHICIWACVTLCKTMTSKGLWFPQ